jgi:guanosine-3',5'-bis(diphosphate) 3'-pyrophosphohydrolase
MAAATFSASSARPFIGTSISRHPIAVASLLLDVGVTEETVLSAAILHDTVEDTDTSKEELEEHFGPAIAKLVEELTDDRTLPRDERKQLQVERAGLIPYRAKLVKLADKVCNLYGVALAPPADWSVNRREAYVDWCEEIGRRLEGTHAELERLLADNIRLARERFRSEQVNNSIFRGASE